VEKTAKPTTPKRSNKNPSSILQSNTPSLILLNLLPNQSQNLNPKHIKIQPNYPPTEKKRSLQPPKYKTICWI
jgi:hypothetical protein